MAIGVHNLAIITKYGVITINEETQTLKIIYEIKDEKVYIYDTNRQRLYNGVFWNLVSINGSTAETLTELDNRLILL